MELFYIKTIDRFQDNCQVFHFRTYPKLESLSRFRDKTHFPVFWYNPLFRPKITYITYKINH